MSAGAPPSDGECPAYPAALRWGAVAILAALLASMALALDEMRQASWSPTGLGLLAAAALCIVWMGYWLLRSRTRLDGTVLTQTWLWTKRVALDDVAQVKLVHWPALEALVAPRLLVRRRSGGVVWIHAANGALLRVFVERWVAARGAGPLEATAAAPPATPPAAR